MTSDVIVAAMAKSFALITHQALEFDRLLGEEDQPGCAIAAGKIERVGPDQEQRFTGSGRNVAGGWPADVRTGAGARARSAHGWAGARGEGAAKARIGGWEGNGS